MLMPYKIKPKTISIDLDKIPLNQWEVQVLNTNNELWFDADKKTLEIVVKSVNKTK